MKKREKTGRRRDAKNTYEDRFLQPLVFGRGMEVEEISLLFFASDTIYPTKQMGPRYYQHISREY